VQKPTTAKECHLLWSQESRRKGLLDSWITGNPHTTRPLINQQASHVNMWRLSHLVGYDRDANPRSFYPGLNVGLQCNHSTTTLFTGNCSIMHFQCECHWMLETSHWFWVCRYWALCWTFHEQCMHPISCYFCTSLHIFSKCSLSGKLTTKWS
jgi:hypothetical protein